MNLFGFFRRKPVAPANRYSGGDGSSISTAIVIEADSALVGVRAEYEYVEKLLGKRGRDWTLCEQALGEHDGKPYDELTIVLRSGQRRTFYFDISRFFDKP